MAGEIPIVSGALEKRPLHSMQSLEGGHTSVQEGHASNHTPISQMPSSYAVHTTTILTANLWCPAANTIPQVEIVTTTPQIVTTHRTETPVSQQQSLPLTSSTGTWISHSIQP